MHQRTFISERLYPRTFQILEQLNQKSNRELWPTVNISASVAQNTACESFIAA